jgi:hypothetical protein
MGYSVYHTGTQHGLEPPRTQWLTGPTFKTYKLAARLAGQREN